MLNEGNQIHNFIQVSSSGSGTVINYGSGSDFLTSYSSGSTSQKSYGSYGSGSGSTTLPGMEKSRSGINRSRIRNTAPTHTEKSRSGINRSRIRNTAPTHTGHTTKQQGNGGFLVFTRLILDTFKNEAFCKVGGNTGT